MEQRSLEQWDRIDLVDFLATIGIPLKNQKGNDHYYVSPLAGHPDHPTFIVDRSLNRWRETTTQERGGLTDLAVRLYDCTIGELTAILLAVLPPVQHRLLKQSPDDIPQVTIERLHSIRSPYLERFLWEHRIPVLVAQFYCQEAWYCRGKSLFQALAFRNNAGGFELFSPNRRYRVQPYGPTLISNQSQELAIFQHILDLLTFVTIYPGRLQELPDLLVLNAPIIYQSVQEIVARYPRQHLFLPNNAAGIAFATLATKNLRHCQDHRSLYLGYPTLNDWICRIGTATSPQNHLTTPIHIKPP